MSYSGMGMLGSSATTAHQVQAGLQVRQLQEALNALGVKVPVDGIPSTALADALRSIAPRFSIPTTGSAYYYARPTGEHRFVGLRVNDRLKDALLQAVTASVSPPGTAPGTPLPGERPLTITPPPPGQEEIPTTDSGGFPWLWVIGGVVVVGGVGAVLYMKKKKAASAPKLAANRRRRR